MTSHLYCPASDRLREEKERVDCVSPESMHSAILKPLVGYGGVESVSSSDSTVEGVALSYSWSTTTDHGSDDRFWRRG